MSAKQESALGNADYLSVRAHTTCRYDATSKTSLKLTSTAAAAALAEAAAAVPYANLYRAQNYVNSHINVPGTALIGAFVYAASGKLRFLFVYVCLR